MFFRIEAESEAHRISRGDVNLDDCDTATLFQPVVGLPLTHVPLDMAKEAQDVISELKKILDRP